MQGVIHKRRLRGREGEGGHECQKNRENEPTSFMGGLQAMDGLISSKFIHHAEMPLGLQIRVGCGHNLPLVVIGLTEPAHPLAASLPCL